MTKDPVCWTDVDERRATTQELICDHKGQRFYFCCKDCQQRFRQQADSYQVRLTEWQTTPLMSDAYIG